MNKLETPVLLLIFNRPELTRQVLEVLRSVQPKKLFLAGDGPRPTHPADKEKVREVREIAMSVDWPCEIHTLFAEQNLGCDIAVPAAINWFFTYVSEGIILEDDCVPAYTFFPFCAELLERYRDDTRVMKIDGTNLAESWPSDSSYFFSRYSPICWGWATWKSSWQNYRDTLVSWPEEKTSLYRKIGGDYGWNVRRWIYERLYSQEKTAWDYKWEYSRMVTGGVSIIPRTNLVKNIGFGEDAAHTKTRRLFTKRTIPLDSPLQHPQNREVDATYDRWVIREIFNSRDLLFQFRKMLLKIFQ